MGHSVIHIDDIEPSGPGGRVRFVRRELGVGAFGINRFDLPACSRGVEHTEENAGALKLNLSEDEISRIDGAFPVRRRRELPVL